MRLRCCRLGKRRIKGSDRSVRFDFRKRKRPRAGRPIEAFAQRSQLADATGRRTFGKVSSGRGCHGLPSGDAKDGRMILLSHPTGNEFVREALAAFDRAGILGEFWTTLSWNSRSQINRMLPRRVRALLERRSFSDSIRSRTRAFPFRESVRL